MEVENGPLKDNFPLQTGGCPIHFHVSSRESISPFNTDGELQSQWVLGVVDFRYFSMASDKARLLLAALSGSSSPSG